MLYQVALLEDLEDTGTATYTLQDEHKINIIKMFLFINFFF